MYNIYNINNRYIFMNVCIYSICMYLYMRLCVCVYIYIKNFETLYIVAKNLELGK